jgi:predicted HTH transcriptional regulator
MIGFDMASGIRELIRNGESSQVEFKKTLPHPEKFARALVAFANSRGGVIIVGISDDHRVEGISDFEEEKYVLEKSAGFFCSPEVRFELSEEVLEGKSLMCISIPESNEKPHYVICENGVRNLYVRSGAQCILASPLVSRALKLEKEGRESLHKGKSSRNEEALFRYLEANKRINLKDYARLINVSKRRASKILIGLTLSGKLFMHHLEKTIFFTRV